jgi:hypothetical protein
MRLAAGIISRSVARVALTRIISMIRSLVSEDCIGNGWPARCGKDFVPTADSNDWNVVFMICLGALEDLLGVRGGAGTRRWEPDVSRAYSLASAAVRI